MTSSTTPVARSAGAPPVVDRLLGRLARHVRRSPAAAATITRGGTASWSEVAADTALLAQALHRRGIGPGTSVALLTGRSRYALTTLLATWSCGATAVLIDERHPLERTAHALRDSGARYALAAEVTSAMLSLGAAILPVTSLISGAGEQGPAGAVPLTGATADSLAYLIYTSGTTGLPKGVEISFGNLDAFVSALQTLNLPEGGVGVNAVSPAFDGWLWCTLLYLVYGQALGIVDLLESDHAGVGAAIDALRPTVVCLTPSLLAACDSELDSAEVIVAAGEVCTPELVARFATGRRMLNVYGPTEATIAATWADSAHGHDLSTIGVALPGYLTYVLDAQRQPVPPGSAGELHIGGPAIAGGYRNLPEFTAQRFSEDPFCSGGRLYATGDIVRSNAAGALEFLGRADNQVKVRGFRVELEELERQAQLLPGVAQATAFALPQANALGLAIRPSTRLPCPSDAELREHLAATLPEYLLPSRIMRHDNAFATTATGKVDRQALAAACQAEPTVEAMPAEQRTATPHEAVIAAIWADLLGAPITDFDANFFAVGGHSLLAAQLASAVREATGVSVSMRELLAEPTVSALAAIVDKSAEDTGKKYAS